MKWERQLSLVVGATPSSVVSYREENSSIVRTVALLSGVEHQTRTVKPNYEAFDMSAQFAKSWLACSERPHLTNTNGEFRIVDLFAGCGGMSLGMEEACRAVGKLPIHTFSAELDPTYAQVYSQNFKPGKMHVGDVAEIFSGALGSPLTSGEQELRAQVGRVDVLCGGPPCQGHSDLNNYTRRSDPRNSLYDRMARAAEVLHPRAVIIENVPGVQRDKTGVFNRTVSFLAKFGYDVRVVTLDAGQFGVPQSRKRTFVLALQSSAHQKHLAEILEQQTISTVRPVSWAIDDLKFGTNDFDAPSRLSSESQKRVDWLFEEDKHELPNSMRPDCHRLKHHTYKSVYGRMYGGRPAPTITTGCLVMGQGRFIHPYEPRTITPHEAARIQTFPDYFDFGTQKRTTYAKMIGNAVPPVLSFAVGLGIVSI